MNGGRASLLSRPDLLSNYPGLTIEEREVFADVDQNGVVDQRDEDALADAIFGIRFLPDFPPTHIIESSPARIVILRFDRRINLATINSNNFYLIANGERLPGRIEVSTTEKFVTFFPASTEIRIVVNPTNIIDRYGRAVAASLASAALPSIDQQNSPEFRYTA